MKNSINWYSSRDHQCFSWHGCVIQSKHYNITRELVRFIGKLITAQLGKITVVYWSLLGAIVGILLERKRPYTVANGILCRSLTGELIHPPTPSITKAISIKGLDYGPYQIH